MTKQLKALYAVGAVVTACGLSLPAAAEGYVGDDAYSIEQFTQQLAPTQPIRLAGNVTTIASPRSDEPGHTGRVYMTPEQAEAAFATFVKDLEALNQNPCQ